MEQKVKFSLATLTHCASLISLSIALSRTPAAYSILPAFAVSHCDFPQNYSQAMLIQVHDYVHAEDGYHPSKKTVQRRPARLIETIVLQQTQTHTVHTEHITYPENKTK